MAAELGREDLEKVRAFCEGRRMSLAVVRTREAPAGLRPLFDSIAGACGLSFGRNMSSPSADFGFAELYSNGKMLVVLYIGGERTELVSLSETDEVFLQDLEDTIASSNIQSSSIRDGL
jgi:hypothetical protein